MVSKQPPNKVISLTQKLTEHQRRSSSAQRSNQRTGTRVIAITSGKGGVGKTNLVANLGVSLARLGKKVLVLDADLGLGNLDILLGLAPRYNLSHVIRGEKVISDVVVPGPGGIQILPASSGIQELTRLTKTQRIRIFAELDTLLDNVDVLLIDTAAGISADVMVFNASAQEIIVVAAPEPTSITDAYALMKVLSLRYSANRFNLVVNSVHNIQEAYEVFNQLRRVTDRFLDVSLQFMGHILYDASVTQSIRHQKTVVQLFPEAPASRCFESLARKIYMSPAAQLPAEDTHFFWDELLQDNSE